MRRVSRVVVAGVTALAAVLAVLGWQAPALLEGRDASDLEPGLLQVQPALRGAVSLGNGVYVQLAAGGLLVTRQSRTVFRGVDRAAPFTAGLGRLEWRDDAPVGSGWAAHDGPRWRVREVVQRSLGNLRVTGRTLQQRSVVYTGRVFDDEPDGPDSLPFTLTVTRRTPDSRIVLDVRVPGADAIAMHSYRRDGYTYHGAGVQSGELLLRDGRFPVLSRSTDVQDTDGASLAPAPVLLSSASNGFALGQGAYSTLDLRHRGRVDATTWSSRLSARLYDGEPLQMVSQLSSDSGLVQNLPVWATAGAVVSVRGSERRVLNAAVRLLDANAALAAVLVADGGQRSRYPRWDSLVDRLSAKDVRVLTSVSPSLALEPRQSGPDDEPALLAQARGRGYLVTGGDGAPLQVAVPDPDVGSVPAVLLDLTNGAAVRWYTDVLANRMRDERLSGWQVLGGAELPPGARLAAGDPAEERSAWPARWSAITRRACQQAGRPDCLLLQDTTGERSVRTIGSVGLGQQATDWSGRGLGGVLPAVLNAGVSGMSIVHSDVGGTSTVSSWSGGRRVRSDELLGRWGELAAMGPLLVTADGDRPGGAPQVWDSRARLQAFATTSRIFAALAQYRRSVLRQAVQDGLPVVRPVWLAEPGLNQERTAGEFMFGGSLLVVPVLTSGQRAVQAHLPAGAWVNLFTGERYEVGEPTAAPPEVASTATDAATPRQVTIDAPMGRAVVLYRAGDGDGVAARQALAGAGLLVPAQAPAGVPQP